MKISTLIRAAWALALTVLLAPRPAHAVPEVLHYEGTLDVDGLAHSGPVEFRFDLNDAAAESQWREEWTGDAAIPVEGGRFAANLGSRVRLPDAVWRRSEVYIKVAARLPGEGAWTVLSGRHRVGVVATGLWSRRATFMNVEGDIIARNGMTVFGNITASSAVLANGQLTVASADLGAVTDASSTFVGSNEPFQLGALDASVAAGELGAVTIDTFDIAGTLTMPQGYGVAGYLALTASTEILLRGTPVIRREANTITINPRGQLDGGTRFRSRSVGMQTTVTHHGDLEVLGENPSWLGDVRVDPTQGSVNVTGTFTPAGLTVEDNYASRGCRLCLNYQVPAVVPYHTCVNLNALAGIKRSPREQFGNGRVLWFELAHVCDGNQGSPRGLGRQGY